MASVPLAAQARLAAERRTRVGARERARPCPAVHFASRTRWTQPISPGSRPQTRVDETCGPAMGAVERDPDRERQVFAFPSGVMRRHSHRSLADIIDAGTAIAHRFVRSLRFRGG